jgi:hypothetical protein
MVRQVQLDAVKHSAAAGAAQLHSYCVCHMPIGYVDGHHRASTAAHQACRCFISDMHASCAWPRDTAPGAE